MELEPGTRFGPYEILSRLGLGGMGVVYRARDTRLGRDVAIKVLQRQFASDPERLRRFEKEARATSALNHPNVLSVFDVGTWEGAPYIVSELLEGTTLRQKLRVGPFGGRSGIDFANQIARGLSAAHQKGIVHRDLKPENLFLTNDGRAKILDFGLAKLLETDADSETTDQTSDTRTGRILGTAGYMSPEQVRGQRPDQRSDIFSLGAILYEMFSGTRPFRGPSVVETLNAILTVEPPPLSLGDVPAGLETVIAHCLEKDPANRFQTAQDLSFALESLRDSSPATKRVSRPRAKVSVGRARWLGGTAILLAAVAIAFMAMTLARRGNEQSPAPKYTRLTFRQGNIAEARFAPDGQTVVYGAAWDGRPMEIFTTRVDGPESRRIGLPAGSVFSVSSRGMLAIADGCELNWGKCRGTLAQVSMTGGSPRKIADDIDWAEWTPDGKDLAIVRPVNGRYRLEFPIGHVLFETAGWMSTPRFSPDGQRIAFCDHPDLGSTSGSVSVVGLDGKRTILSTGWKIVFGLAWRNDDEIWFNGSRTAHSVQTFGVKLDRSERLIVSNAGDFEIVDLSKSGDALFFRTNIRGRMFAGRDKDEHELSWFDWSTAADLSPDGRTLLFYEWGDAAHGAPEVYIRGVDGADATRLGAGKALALSPDGRWALALDSSPGQHLVLLPTGAGEKRLLPAGEIVEFYSATFFPDGRRILIAGEGKDRAPSSYVQDIGGALPPQQVGVSGLVASVVSPDGKEIVAYGAGGKFYRLPVNGGELVPVNGLVAGDTLLQWSDDGRSLFVRAAGDDAVEIDRVEIATGRRVSWRRLTPSDRVGLIDVDALGVCISRDGRSFAYTYWTALQDLYFTTNLH